MTELHAPLLKRAQATQGVICIKNQQEICVEPASEHTGMRSCPVQRQLFGPNQRSNQLTQFRFTSHQRSNQISLLKFGILPNQRTYYQRFWLKCYPNQSWYQILLIRLIPNKIFN